MTVLSYSLYTLLLLATADYSIDLYKAYQLNEKRYEIAYKYKSSERVKLTFCKETQSFIKKSKCKEYSETPPKGKNEK